MDLKRQAAKQALEYVRSGMVLGLGSGSTAWHFVDLLGEKIATGGLVGIQAVPTSIATTEQALSMGIQLTTLSEARRLDLAVDGADDVDPKLNLIKGLGRAALREKIVAVHAMSGAHNNDLMSAYAVHEVVYALSVSVQVARCA